LFFIIFFVSISTADGYEQMTIMTPEKVLPSIVQLINQYSFANSSRYVRIIKVEKVQCDAKDIKSSYDWLITFRSTL